MVRHRGRTLRLPNIQKDKELIEALDLNLKHVTAGVEPAQVARWSQLYKQQEPVLFYFYTPPYLNAQYDLAEVKLPPRTEANKDCQDDAKAGGDPEQYKCEYAVTTINKRLTRLRLPEEVQDHQRGAGRRREAIAGDKVDPEKAGEDWVKENADTVDSWLQ